MPTGLAQLVGDRGSERVFDGLKLDTTSGRVLKTAAAPDGQPSLARYHSKQIGGQNMARFKLPALDAIYERMETLPHGPEREALFAEAKKLAVAYAPYKSLVHRIVSDMAHPRLVGWRRPLFWQDWWHMVDIVEEPAR